MIDQKRIPSQRRLSISLTVVIVLGLSLFSPEAANANGAQCQALFSETHASPLSELLTQAKDPFSLVFDVRSEAASEESFKKQIATLEAILLTATTPKARGQYLSRWVTSDAKALLAYDVLFGLGLSNYSVELNDLIKNNQFFKNSFSDAGGLISFSFEKEDSSDKIKRWYRSAKVSDEEWFDLSDQDGTKQLRALRVPKRKKMGGGRVAATSFKPLALGGYSEELSDRGERGYTWEVVHKKYEINPLRLMSEIREVTHEIGNTHSVHAHVVFEIPINDPHYRALLFWLKHLNDSLYLSGLEEGLHGTKKTGVLNMKSDVEAHDIRHGATVLNEDQAALDRNSNKFFTAGLRANIYGEASRPGYMKIGIEFRDSTRNLDLLQKTLLKAAKSISERVWENVDESQLEASSLRLTSSRAKAQRALAQILAPEDAELFSRLEPTIHFGLLDFESRRTYNYQSQSWNQVLPENAEIFKMARQEFIHDLRALAQNIKDVRARREKVSDDEIEYGLRWTLSDWAKSARPSELFKDY